MRVAILGVLLLCVGCAAASANLSPDKGLSGLDKDGGLVIFSTGAEVVSKAGSVHVQVLGPALADGSVGEAFVRKANFFTMDRGFEDSDFPPEHVVVRMVRARPGTMCITFYDERIGVSGGLVTATTRTAKVSARIDVAAGAAIYAGSLVLDKDLKLAVLDRKERDLTRVKAGNPALPLDQIVTQPMQLTDDCRPSPE